MYFFSNICMRGGYGVKHSGISIFYKKMCIRVLQSPHKIEHFVVATSTLAQVGGFAQKSLRSSFVKICQCLGVAQMHSDIKILAIPKKKTFFSF